MTKFRTHFRKLISAGAAVTAALLIFVFAGDHVILAQDSTTPAPQAVDSTKANEISPDEISPAEQKRRNESLSKFLTGSKWEGQFTLTNEEKPPAKELYEIVTAEKAETGDYWNLVARIKYGEHDTTMPLPPLEIKWAGPTPVITVDQVKFMGFGTFDARVLIRKGSKPGEGKYAGTWSHNDVGGHLFGTIKRIEKEDKENESKEK